MPDLPSEARSFGRWSDRITRPFLLYLLLEAGVAALGVLATLLLARSAAPFAAIEAHAGLMAWTLPFAIVGAPAFLMGGTLPLAIRAWARQQRFVAAVGGRVYATNTAGGIVGALLSTFVLLPNFGVRGTAYAAALLNLAAAVAALFLDRRLPPYPPSKPAAPAALTRDARLALVLYALAGGIALGYEVVWSQAIVQFLSTRSFAFSIVLAAYLAGLAIGAALYSRVASRFPEAGEKTAWGAFGLLISAAGLLALLEIAGLSVWQLTIQAEIGKLVFSATGNEFTRMSWVWSARWEYLRSEQPPLELSPQCAEGASPCGGPCSGSAQQR